MLLTPLSRRLLALGLLGAAAAARTPALLAIASTGDVPGTIWDVLPDPVPGNPWRSGLVMLCGVLVNLLIWMYARRYQAEARSWRSNGRKLGIENRDSYA